MEELESMTRNIYNLLILIILVSCVKENESILDTTLSEYLQSSQTAELVESKLSKEQKEKLSMGVVQYLASKKINTEDISSIDSLSISLAEVIELRNQRIAELDSMQNQKDNEVRKMNSIVSIDIIGKKVMEDENGVMRRALIFDLNNISDKTISQVNMVFHIQNKVTKDQITNLSYSVDMVFPPGITMETTAYWDYDPLKKEDIIFKGLNLSEMEIEMFATSIQFDDGTVANFNGETIIPIL